MEMLSLDLTVQERYQLLGFLPSHAPRHVVMGPFEEIQAALGLSDDQCQAWGFERTEGGVRRPPGTAYDDEATRCAVAMPRRLWVRLRAGADSSPRFPNTELARRCYRSLVSMLNEAATGGPSSSGNGRAKPGKKAKAAHR